MNFFLRQVLRVIRPGFKILVLKPKVKFLRRYGYGLPPHPELNTIINRNRETYKSYLQKALKYSDQVATIRNSSAENDRMKPVWDNGYFPGLDTICIYMMLSELKPANYVEIGSGNSSKVVYKAKQEQGLKTTIVSIDPSPKDEIKEIADVLIQEPFENIDTSLLYGLYENDVIFIDNANRILPNSDAMVFFMEILPRLHKGVVVQLHDIYLPYDYPEFMLKRFYSGQYALAMYLLSNPERYEILLPNFFIHNDKELSSIIAPVWEKPNLKNVERHGGSFWFRIK